jgi:hypothetical protein
MSVEDTIKTKVRLFALETLFCQFSSMQFQIMPREIFDAVKQQALDGAQKHVFPGFDPAYSDVVSSEFENALGRLYGMIQHHLDTARKRQQR